MFQNIHQRLILPRAFKPDDAPQAYVNDRTDLAAVRLGDLRIGAFFWYDAYPDGYPGAFFEYEVDSIADDVTCLWVSNGGKLMTNIDEDTLCFSELASNTEVYVSKGHTEDMVRSFSPTPEESLKSFDMYSVGSSIHDIRMDALEKKIESIEGKMNEIQFALGSILRAVQKTP